MITRSVGLQLAGDPLYGSGGVAFVSILSERF